MKINSMHRLLALLTGSFTALGLSAHAQLNLVQNGSFEVITVVPGIETRARPWQGELSYNTGWANSPDGRNFAHIGTVYQDIPTAPGQIYGLSFWVAADLYVQSTGTAVVRWGNEDVASWVTQPHPYDPGINRYEQIVWERVDIAPLLATGPMTRLELLAADNSLLLLDDVRLIQVPEPASTTLVLTGWLIFYRRHFRTR